MRASCVENVSDCVSEADSGTSQTQDKTGNFNSPFGFVERGNSGKHHKSPSSKGKDEHQHLSVKHFMCMWEQGIFLTR